VKLDRVETEQELDLANFDGARWSYFRPCGGDAALVHHDRRRVGGALHVERLPVVIQVPVDVDHAGSVDAPHPLLADARRF
jgi:hypothetical protein